jgi:potassium-transporting ATPase KdpC subunit
MLTHVRPAVMMLVLLTALTGLAYPLAVTGVAQLAMPGRANGSLVENAGTISGSRLIGQTFSSPKYFYSRPSAAGNGYDASSSSGSNLGPTSRKFLDVVKDRIDKLGAGDGQLVPADAVEASASGLDPHITPAFAEQQVMRIAGARGVPEDRVHKILTEHAEGTLLGLFGEPRVNVLDLNMALDRELAGPS